METGYDILFLGCQNDFDDDLHDPGSPFKTVYLHGLVRTRDGKKMSKSDPLTCIDPLESIRDYGTDALRLALIQGQDQGKISGFILKSWRAAGGLQTKSGMQGVTSL